MPSLLDEPSDHALRLLGVVAIGYVEASGCWPFWQWVQQQLWHTGLDAEEVLHDLPTWQYEYRSVRAGSRGMIPKVGEAISLSVHGMAHTAFPETRALAGAFVTALRTAATMQQAINPSPTQVEEVTLAGEEFTKTVNMMAGTELSVNQLFDV